MRNRLTLDQRRYLAEHISVLLLVAALSVLLSVSGALSFIDRYLYDNLLQTLPDEPASDVVIVGIDEYSLREIGRWPWDRKVHAQIIDRLTELGARAVLVDLILSEPPRHCNKFGHRFRDILMRRDHGAHTGFVFCGHGLHNRQCQVGKDIVLRQLFQQFIDRQRDQRGMVVSDLWETPKIKRQQAACHRINLTAYGRCGMNNKDLPDTRTGQRFEDCPG